MAKSTKDEIESAINSLGPLAKVLNKSAGGLWKIFVRRYVAIGTGLLGLTIVIPWLGIWLLPHKSWWLMVPFGIALVTGYYAIINLINPYYPAMDDVIKHVKAATKPSPVEVMGPNFRIGPR